MNDYCLVKDGKVVSGPRTLPKNWSRVSNLQSLSDSELLALGWYLCEYPTISFDPLTQKKLSYTFDIQADKVVINYQIGDKSQGELDQDLKNAKDSAKRKVNDLLTRNLYTDVEVTFPSGQKVIQFRDITDRINLSNVMQSAQSLIASAPTTELVYRTKDNVNQVVTAAEMLPIGMDVMAAKQAIQDISWDHKDAIEALTTIAEVEAYDVTTIWPIQDNVI